MEKNVKSFTLVKVLFFIAMLVSATLHAADAKKTGGNKEHVLDFEADVIEGEKKRPDIFMEFVNDLPNLDSILLQRNDFNDFHKNLVKERPKYQTKKK